MADGLNAMIPISGQAPQIMSLADYQQLQYRNALQGAQLGEMQRKVQGQNMMREALRQPGAMGPGGQISPEVMQRMMQADPETAINFQNQMLERQQLQMSVEEGQRLTQERDQAAKMGRLNPVMRQMHDKWFDELQQNKNLTNDQRLQQWGDFRKKMFDSALRSGEITQKDYDEVMSKPVQESDPLTLRGRLWRENLLPKQTHTERKGGYLIQYGKDILGNDVEIDRAPEAQLAGAGLPGNMGGLLMAGYNVGQKNLPQAYAEAKQKAPWLTDQQVAMNAKEAESLQASIRQQEVALGKIGGFERTALANLESLADTLKKQRAKQQMDIPLVNRFLNEVRRQAGSPDNRDIGLYATEAASELTKLASSANAAGSGGTLTDREHWLTFFAPNSTFDQMMQSINAAKQSADNRVKGARDEIADSQQRLQDLWKSPEELAKPTPKAEREKAGKKPPTRYSDPEKERRYQEWLKTQRGG